VRTRTHGKEDGKEEDGKGELHTMDSSGILVQETAVLLATAVGLDWGWLVSF